MVYNPKILYGYSENFTKALSKKNHFNDVPTKGVLKKNGTDLSIFFEFHMRFLPNSRFGPNFAVECVQGGTGNSRSFGERRSKSEGKNWS